MSKLTGRITSRWIDLKPHPGQLAYANSPHRFNVVPAGRRSGKTERAKRKLVARALRTAGDVHRYFAAAPTREQAKRIYWQDLKALVPKYMLLEQPRESELIIRLINGGEIYVLGIDKPERIEGQPWDGGVLDEYGNVRAEAWGENIRPALSDRNGWCDLIGVPEGRNHYYDQYKEAQERMLTEGDRSPWGAFTWVSADILPADEIEEARRDLDPLTFQQEYEASFVNFTGRAYYNFNDVEHCARLHYDPEQPIAVCFDFNVSPGVAVIAQEQLLANGLKGTGVIGEVYIPRNSNTPAVCNKIIDTWGDHRSRVYVYGDATGGAAGSAKVAGSDWEIINRMLSSAFGGLFINRVGRSNPRERERVNAVNTRCKSGAGAVRFMVDPSRAPRLVKDLEGVRTLDGGSGEIDKRVDPKLTHLSDAIGYYIVKEFPIHDKRVSSTVFAF